MELIQDFEFPTCGTQLTCTSDGQYIVATGTYNPLLLTIYFEGVYSPQVRIFDLNQLSLKVERHFDNEVVNFKVLSEDYSKLVFLRTDRTIDFHAQFGFYYRMRLPSVNTL